MNPPRFKPGDVVYWKQYCVSGWENEPTGEYAILGGVISSFQIIPDDHSHVKLYGSRSHYTLITNTTFTTHLNLEEACATWEEAVASKGTLFR